MGLDAALHVGEAAQPEHQHPQASIRSTRADLAIGPGLVGGLFIVVANIIVDIAYVLLDPRVR